MLTLLMVLIVLGIIWTLIPYLGLDEPFPKIIKLVLIVVLIYFLLGAIGMVPAPAVRW